MFSVSRSRIQIAYKVEAVRTSKVKGVKPYRTVYFGKPDWVLLWCFSLADLTVFKYS